MNRTEYMRNYMKDYRKRNKKKIEEINRRYWEKKIELYHKEQEQNNATGDTTNEG